VIAAMAGQLAVFNSVPLAAPPAGFRPDGQGISRQIHHIRAEARTTYWAEGQKIPRQPHRYSGRTAMRAHIAVSEPKPPDDPDSALAFSMEGAGGAAAPAALVPFFWSPGWNSPSAVNKYQDEVGGALRGGPAGVRLIEPRRNGPAPFFRETPPSFTKRQGEWLLVPLHHIFGSEEQSAQSPPIAERSPRPCLALNPNDANALGLGAGDEIEVTIDGKSHKLPVRILAGLPDGVGGLPAGLPTLEGIALPRWVKLSFGPAL